MRSGDEPLLDVSGDDAVDGSGHLAMTAVQMTGAVVVLEGFPALAGVDLRIDREEVVLVRGANGAGKSTLLGLCAGLVPITSGEGEILGCDLRSERAAVRRHVGLIGHDTALYSELSAAENLRLWARAARLGDADAQGALQRLGLRRQYWDVPTSRLSAGQRRRVGIAALLLRRPELWLLDEPHAALDSDGRDRVDNIVAEAASAGAAVLVASHESGRVESLADRVITLAGGIVTSGVG